MPARGCFRPCSRKISAISTPGTLSGGGSTQASSASSASSIWRRRAHRLSIPATAEKGSSNNGSATKIFLDERPRHSPDQELNVVFAQLGSRVGLTVPHPAQGAIPRACARTGRETLPLAHGGKAKLTGMMLLALSLFQLYVDS